MVGVQSVVYGMKKKSNLSLDTMKLPHNVYTQHSTTLYALIGWYIMCLEERQETGSDVIFVVPTAALVR